jgi:hypothetical protein
MSTSLVQIAGLKEEDLEDEDNNWHRCNW